ncbi:MAG: DUF1697 domain-containing protein [Rhodothermia bacterium]|nr:DUF1697 domain-containing protein [Rhodothermia bacterium]
MSFTYIVLLRGINVGGHKKIRMQDLTTYLQEMGLEDVKTYIQSGNLVVKTSETDPVALSERIAQCIKKHYPFEVEVIVRTLSAFRKSWIENPFLARLDADPEKIYVTYLINTPTHKQATSLTNIYFPPEEFIWQSNEVYVYCSNGYGRTKLDNGLFERKLQTKATTRNLKTIRKLLEMADET